MKLVHTTRPLDPAWPAFLAYYCAACCYAETRKEQRNASGA
jgi:hypothetical protein